jgi:hypothetical protein
MGSWPNTLRNEPPMRIGVDFDNTLADYDALFVALAVEEGLLSAPVVGGKRAVRDAVRQSVDGEFAWRRLQALAYGPRMGQAVLMPGAGEFLAACAHQGLDVTIISHKSRRAADASVTDDLRDAAMGWMQAQGFFDRFGLSEDRVFFEDTRESKVGRIGGVRCTHFIDDLEEVFLTPGFPEDVRRILFDRDGVPTRQLPFETFRTWEEIADACFSTAGTRYRKH